MLKYLNEHLYEDKKVEKNTKLSGKRNFVFFKFHHLKAIMEWNIIGL